MPNSIIIRDKQGARIGELQKWNNGWQYIPDHGEETPDNVRVLLESLNCGAK